MNVEEIKAIELKGIIEKITVSTAQFAGADAVSTELELDFSNLTVGDVIEYCIRSVVIRKQSAWRNAANRKENAEKIPETCSELVAKPGSRGNGMVSTEKAMELILKKAGGDVAKAIAMLQEKAKK